MGIQQSQSSNFALNARDAKKRAALQAGIDEALISSVVDRVYGRVRNDPLLGPIFLKYVQQWDEHLERMKRFWRSVMHNSGEYNGRPMPKHVAIEGLDDTHFERWLRLFYETLRELAPSEAAIQQFGSKARTIADSLLTGIALHHRGLIGSKAGRNLPHV